VTTVAKPSTAGGPADRRSTSRKTGELDGGLRPARVFLHVSLGVVALSFLLPLLWAAYTSLRPYEETAKYGYVSIARSLTLENYRKALDQGDLLHFLKNTMLILVPALLLILFLSSMVAFVLSRFRFRGQLALLMVFTAGNLLPQQVIITPLYRMYRSFPLPEWMSDSGTLFDSYWGLILIHVAFQIGFCTFVLSNYMKTLPEELTEAARVDGASVWRQYWQITLPLCRAPLAALATLEFTWIYNDFFWALVLMVTGDKRPITSSLNNLQGQFFTDNNLVAAGSLLVALPTVLVYFLLQKHFIGGLTMGATKG
jgi:multiple sugar transport system permease protein